MQKSIAVALLGAAALAGCSHPAQRAGAASTAAGVSSGGPPSLTLTQPELVVTKATPLVDGAVLSFSAPLDPASAGRGSVVGYRDTDEDPGGAFEPLPLETSVAGDTLRVRARVPLDAREVRLVLSDALATAGGERLQESEGSAALTFPDALPGAVYELRFRARPPLVAGALARNVTDDHGGDAALATALVGRGTGRIEAAGDRDWFRVELLAGEAYVLRTETAGDTVLALYAGDGTTLLAQNDDAEGGRHSRIAFSATTTGAHYLEVAGFGQTTPDYVLFAEGALGAPPGEPGGDRASARPLALGEQLSDRVGPGDQDWFRLDLVDGREVSVEVDHPDVTLMLLDDAGQGAAEPTHTAAAGETLGGIAARYGIDYRELAGLNGIADPNRLAVGQVLHVPGTSSLAFTPTRPGTYYLRLEGFAGAAPAYSLSVRATGAPTPPPTPAPVDDHGNDPAHATSLALGATASGAIEQAGDVDLFAVDLAAGRTYELVVATSGDSRLALLDASGAQLAENDDDPQGGRGSRIVHAASATARHYLRVSGYGSGTPAYTLGASLRAASSLPDPSRFRTRAGTDPWQIDFTLRADLFAQDLSAHGLASGDADTDRLMRERVIEGLLSHLARKYRQDADGRPVAGASWKVSFTSGTLSGRAGRDYSREAVGGTHKDGSGTLGVSYLDPGSRRKEDNATLGELGIFSASIWGRDSRLSPALSPADKRFLDGSYLLGDGSASDDRRMRRIREVADDWAHALAVVTAHEVGHSVGLDHDESDPRGIMQPALSRSVLSDDATQFAPASAQTLTTNLRTD
ncbi:MAG: pre-peptidase C-terminal domain-containing protein [Planctomycetota bacterium]